MAMINFACKEFRLEEVVKCALALTKADYKLLDYMMKQKQWFTTEELAKTLKLNLSTIQRSVKKLYEKEILERKQNNLDGGGYLFVYNIRDQKAVRDIIMNIVESWKEKVEKELQHW